MGHASNEIRFSRALAFAGICVLTGSSAHGQGSQHALHFSGVPTQGADRVVLAIDDDAPGIDASTAADVGASDFTIEFWVRGTLSSNPTPSGGGDREYFVQNWKVGNVVVDREIAGSNGAEFGVAIAGGFVRFGTGKGAQAPFDAEHTLEGGMNVLDGNWHHVACVRNAMTGQKRIFVDGALDIESGDVSRGDLSYPNDGANQGGHLPSLVLGADAYDAGSPRFEGDLDEFRLWSRALSASQILSRFDRVMPSQPSGLAAWYRFEEGAGPTTADASANGGPSALVAASSSIIAWTDYASNPSSCAPISFGMLPPGFQRVVLTEALTQPTAFDFLPDGRIVIAERGGAIRIFQNGAMLSNPAIQFAVDNSNGERGLLGIARHPQFASNGFVYVFYTTSEPRDRVSRFTLAGNSIAANSELVVWQAPALASQYHHGGALGFDAAGNLLVGVGDQLNSQYAQDLASPFGKLLRLRDDGAIPSDNPFVSLQGAMPGIYASGFRNPFRLTVDSGPAGLGIVVGDVGGNTTNAFEEVDCVNAGGNFGWPLQEGDQCYVGDCAAISPPFFDYRHDDPDDFVLYPQGSITMGAVYRGGSASSFPSSYLGNLFIADYANRSIRRVLRDSSGGIGAIVAAPQFLWPGLGRTIVDLKAAPDGSLYYLAYGVTYGGLPDQPGLLRISYIGNANAPPLVAASASPLLGPSPLTVHFSSAGTLDPDGPIAGLSYAWAFGDGQFAATPNPTHVYANKGKFVASLTVSDGALAATSDPIVIEVGSKPIPVLASPVPNLAYAAGDVIAFSGTASDQEDGILPPSLLAFEVLLVHEDHVHPFFGPTIGVASGSFTIPKTGHAPASTYFQIRLTATDSDGLAATTSVDLHPNVSSLAFSSIPPGVPLVLDGEPIGTPHVEASIDGFEHAVAAPLVFASSGATYAFSCWSDGGAAAHVVAAPVGGLNLAALYHLVAPTSVSIAVAAADRNAQYQSTTGVLLASASDPNALFVGKDVAGYQTAFEFASPLPVGSVVVSASLELTGSGDGFGQPACAIRAYDVADAPPFVAGSQAPLVQVAPMTSATVTWAVPHLDLGTSVFTPDLSAILQEVLDRPDYAPGARVGLVLDGSANTLSHFYGVKRFGTATPPRLHLAYVMAGPSGGCAPPCGFTTYGPSAGSAKAADSLGLVGTGSPSLGGTATIVATGLKNAASSSLLVSLSPGSQPFLGGTLLVGLSGFLAVVPLPTFQGESSLSIPIGTDPLYAGITLYFQAAAADPSQIAGVALSNGLRLTLCP